MSQDDLSELIGLIIFHIIFVIFEENNRLKRENLDFARTCGSVQYIYLYTQCCIECNGLMF